MKRILVDCPIKSDATSFYRGWGPLSHLQRKHPEIELIDARLPGRELSWDLMIGMDIMFSQRPSTIDQTGIIQIAKTVGLPVWIDYDDDYLVIPETNPRHELYANPHRVAHIKKAIDLADVITVSTPHIKEQIVSQTGKNPESIIIIPNAVDEMIFDTKMPSSLGDRRTVLWRGGDTHNHDIAPFIDAIERAYKNYPDFDWVFFGHYPLDLLGRLDCKRVKQFDWTDVMGYFHRLFEIRPKLTIVPWDFTPFNKAKSNCSFLESTLAGGATLFPSWSTELADGMIGYDDAKDFEKRLNACLSTTEMFPMERLVGKSFDTLQKYTLHSLNWMRWNILERYNFSLSDKLSANVPIKQGKTCNHQEAFDYMQEICCTQDHDVYQKAHWAAADWLMELYDPGTVVEFGCGPGAMLERFLDQKVIALGWDLNPHLQDYFIKRNPLYAGQYLLSDFTQHELDGVADLAVSIECFEHIPAEVIEPYIEKMSHHFKHMYFSSTPFSSTVEHDQFWGHVNVHPIPYWVELFKRSGWEVIGNPQKLCSWDMLLKSTKHSSSPSASDASLPPESVSSS